MSEAAWKPTACILCECNCGIEVQLGGDNHRRLLRFRGDKAHPASQGYACEKPHRLDYYQNNPERLLHPLRRRADGSFEEISWDVAITEVAQRLAHVRDTFGGPSIFYYGGGGQGNHLPGTYATATRRLLGSRYRSSALAQEKTGEFWVSDRMVGMQTRGDFEHCEVAMFLGKNPWHSHSIARARTTLKAIAKSPDRKMIVVDPRKTETAAMADIHLQVKPGCDAWLLKAMVAVLFEEDLIDHVFVAQHIDGFEEVKQHFSGLSIAELSRHCGVSEAQIRTAVQTIAAAKSFASFEDLGVQMNRNSTLVSYLHRLLWMLTGNLGKQGTHYVPTGLVDIASGANGRLSPVAKAPIISGLVPCNVIAEEILTDHEDRYRAMIVEAANPAHSLADSKRMREALGALDTLVVIDVALTETAKLADYVLPASTQFEKAEATFFNFEFPHNAFQLRHRLFEAPEGPLPEAEIHTRLCEALGGFDEETMRPLHEAAQQGLQAYGMAFMQHVLANQELSKVAAAILYRTLGPVLPAGTAEGAVLLGLAFRAAMQSPEALARAGFEGQPPVVALKLFEAIINSPRGFVMAQNEWSDVKVRTPNGRIQLALEDLLSEMSQLGDPSPPDSEYPLVLSAGERRAFTANTIIRDPKWRKKDAGGSLRMHPKDAEALNIEDTDQVEVKTRRGSAVVTVEINDSMQPGHISLPNGMGLGGPNPGDAEVAGTAPNELTDNQSRDRFAGTPWHKYVPARVRRLTADT